MQQIPLDIRLDDHAVFESFCADGNEILVDQLRAAANGAGRSVTWLWGAPQSGRSHLLQAAVAAAALVERRCAYLPLGDSSMLPAMLEGLAAFDLVSLDDIDRVAGDSDWERALFGLFEEQAQSGGRLVVTAASPPAETGFSLPDLRSRMASGAVFHVHPLTDSGRRGALQSRARFRGLELPEETADWLLARVSRRPADLFALLDTLDRAALAARKRLTIPFVRRVLAEAASREDQRPRTV